jgi:hypothetical protein
MAAAAIPIAMGVSSWIGSRKSTGKTEKIASTPTAEEQAAGAGASGAAGKLGGIGETLYGQGQGTLGRATSYYETLLGRGGRGAMESAVAPAAESISDLYGGMSKSLEGSNVRGGVRDLALAEAEREKRGKISRLTAGVQPGAAAALGNIGRFQTGAGIGATGQSGGIYADLLGKGLQGRGLGLTGRLEAEKSRRQTGQDIGNMLFSLLSSGAGKSGGGGGYKGLPLGG